MDRSAPIMEKAPTPSVNDVSNHLQSLAKKHDELSIALSALDKQGIVGDNLGYHILSQKRADLEDIMDSIEKELSAYLVDICLLDI